MVDWTHAAPEWTSHFHAGKPARISPCTVPAACFRIDRTFLFPHRLHIMKKASAFLLAASLLAGPGLSAEGIEYDRIRLPIRGDWQKAEQSGYAMFARSGKPGGVLVLQSMRGGPEMLDRFLTRLMEAHSEGRTLAKVFPEQLARGKTKSGLTFAGQGRVTKSDKDIWYCQYFAFDLGGSLQAVVVFAETPDAFKELSAVVAPGLELAAALTQTTPAAQLPTPATGPTSTFQQTGIMPDQFVSGVVSAQSAELKPIQFRITGGMGISPDNLVLTHRDQTGAMYMIKDTVGDMAVLDTAREIHRIQDFQKPQKTGLTREFLMKVVKQLGKEKVDLFFVNTSPVHQMSVDRKGNLFIGQTIEDHNAFMLRNTSGDVSLIASPSQLKKISNGWHTNRDASRIRPTSEGNAWLFVQGPEANGKNYGTLAYALLKTEQGFKSKQVVPSFRGRAYDRVAAYGLFNSVTVDPEENLVFYNKGSFWKIQPSGEITEILRLALPTGGVSVAGPVILDNGDIWLAFSTEYNINSYANVTNGAVDIRNTWFMVGDRSRLVRIRIAGGKVELGEISSERILDALRKARLTRSDSGVMKTALLRRDFKTGGLVLVDSHHNVLYGLTAD